MDRPIDRRTLAAHIAADVDRAAPLLARMLLVRAVWNLHHHYGDHALWVAQDMAADCREDIEEAGVAARELARALVPDHDADRDLTDAVDATRSLSVAIRRENDAYARYSMATDPDIPIDEERAGRLSTEWDEERSNARAASIGLPADLGSGEAGSRLLDRALSRVFKRGLYYHARHYLLSAEPERAWRRRVADVLHGAACVRLARGNAAATGDLTRNVREGRRVLDGTSPSAWARQAVSRLEETAVPVLTERAPATANRITAIRLAALCLAYEADVARAPAAGDPFRGLVLGITLLERDGAFEGPH
ncbi:hypothetical protein HUT06_35690 [Actinomadura sp. NAK00032]|uniref:hypothetical protein n=1 Tax=Actinomadura sp. NAK00032 TaxID=2742128 RepID=UPI001592A005|nr:hypothetical protein [Actinomadura sp. NAK00032]QKW38706.1 hypothetical protein HUT06_35690 [Actinomadura sp. NAK00032]